MNPVLLYFSQELRPYALIVLLSGVAFVAFLAFLDHGGRRSLTVWTVASAALLWLQYYDLLFVAPQAAWLLYAALRDPSRRARSLVAVAAVAVSAAPLVFLIAYQQPRTAHYVDLQLSGTYQQIVYTSAAAAAAVTPAGLTTQSLVGDGGPAKDILALLLMVMLATSLALAGRLRGDPEGDAARRCAIVLAPAGLVACALLALRVVPLQARYLLAGWLPLTCLVGCGLTLPRYRAVGATLAVAIGALWLWVGIAAYASPKFASREDVRAAARSLGPAREARVVALSQMWDLLPMKLYRPDASGYAVRYARVREVDVIAMPGTSFPFGADHDRPDAPKLHGLPPALRVSDVITGDVYMIVRYVAPSPVTIDLAPAGPFNASWRFLYEPAGGRLGSL